MKYALILLTLLASILVACSDDEEAEVDIRTATETTSPRATAATRTATRSPAALTKTPENVCATNPDPAEADVVQVDSPSPGDSISSPATVEGRIAAFEATFQITIFDAAGGTIADQLGMSSEGQTLAPFSEEVTFSVSEETPACLWVYEYSARDGSRINIVQVPVTLEP